MSEETPSPAMAASKTFRIRFSFVFVEKLLHSFRWKIQFAVQDDYPTS